MSLWEIWRAFQAAHNALHFLISPAVAIDRFDNPFLVNYVAYHHYRSLGWVVKSGIKFCVDLLLYKRGPVFSHAEQVTSICVTCIGDLLSFQVRHRTSSSL
jgi:tRNA-splicing endonuclease subunit Sen2